MATIEDITGWRPLAEPPLSPAGASEASQARTLLDVFARTVTRHPGRVAIDAPDATLTYAQLAAAVERLADQLRDAGVGPGERVGVRLPSGASSLYIAILAILHAGAAYVPVDADDPPARARDTFASAGVCGVLEQGLRFRRQDPASLDTGGGASLDAGGGASLDAGSGTQLDANARAKPAGLGPLGEYHPTARDLSAADDAWIIFTSGSTGRPKGVAISHRSAVAFIEGEARLWTVGPEDRVLAGLSIAFDASCEEMWLAWSTGAALVPAPRALVRSGADLGAWLTEREISVVSTVPTLAAMWDDDALAGVRLLILGGEACPPELGWRLAREREVWNTYGPTEATVVSTAARIRPDEPITIGWPLHGWRVAVVDRQGLPVPYGEPGELAIGGAGLGRYLDSELDTARYAPLPALGWERAYRSGDIVRETIDGYEFIGRRDDQVKLGGRRLELGEIEAQLTAIPGVRAAAAAVQRTEADNPVLVGYLVGDVDPSYARARLTEYMPSGLAPLIVALDSLPTTRSGKVDRGALPWPPPRSLAGNDAGASAGTSSLSPTEAWLAERWREQLGPVPIAPDSDLFDLGASSIAVAKLVSVLRARCPAVAVADVYAHRRLAELAAHLETLTRRPHVGFGEPDLTDSRLDGREGTRRGPTAGELPSLKLGALQLGGLLLLTALASIQWVIVVLAYGNIESDGLPHVGWLWLIGAWLALCSPAGHVTIAILARRALLPDGLTPGRYPRNSNLMARIWLLERLGEHCRIARMAGTPWAARYARLIGADIAADARLASMPTLTSLVHIGAGATVESEVDMRGWWIDGQELVIGEVRIAAGASIGARTLLSPGAAIGEGAEIEPGSVVRDRVPADEHWGGSPARRLGPAGAGWPAAAPSRTRRARMWRLMFSAGLAWEGVLVLLAIAPAIGLLVLIGAPAPTLGSPPLWLVGEAGVFVVVSTIVLALGVALTLRLVWRFLRPGWHGDDGSVAWALWFSGEVQESAGGALFPLYASLYTRAWLRLMGIDVGRRTEISTSTGLSPLVSFGALSQATDDVAFCTARARGGWLHLEPIRVGERTFLGPGAVLREGTGLGDRTLVGALTLAPRSAADGSSWFGVPALELPRVAETAEPARTTDPPPRLVLARGVMDAIRIVGPNTLSVTIGLIDFLVLVLLGTRLGIPAMIALAPLTVLASGIASAALAVALKWIVMGRYRPGQHPLWSAFVWRDELINSTHEQLAGEWLLRFAIGTPLMSAYLRAMGAHIGRGVWCETTAVTEFDLIELGDGAVVNRGACLMTHVFHDRLLRIGPTSVGAGATLGPTSAVLPDTRLGDETCIGPHSVVLRGETLPARTRWHGAPVVSVPFASA